MLAPEKGAVWSQITNVCPTYNLVAYNCVIHIVTMYTEFVLY